MPQDRIPTLLDIIATSHWYHSSGSQIPTLKTLPKHLKDKIRRSHLKRGHMPNELFDALIHEQVRDVDLSACEVVTDSMVISLHRARGLRRLDLNNVQCQFDIKSLSNALSDMWGLRILFLRRSNADDSLLKVLGKFCIHLEEIDLGYCVGVGDTGIGLLGEGCSKLKSLNFSSTSITDLGIQMFVQGEGRECVNELRVDGCGLTDDGIQLILMFCPNLHILIFHNCPLVTDDSRVALEEYRVQNEMSLLQLSWTVY